MSKHADPSILFSLVQPEGGGGEDEGVEVWLELGLSKTCNQSPSPSYIWTRIPYCSLARKCVTDGGRE